MADRAPTRQRWLGRLIFAALGLLLILIQLIPLETVPPSLGGQSIQAIDPPTGESDLSDPTLVNPAAQDPVRWIAPDFLLLLTLVWIARRPSFVPALVVAALFLMTDFLLQRPPGLWAGLVLILSEVLRARTYSLRTQPFWVEWATVGIGLIAITVVNRFTLSMVLVPQASLGLTLLQLTLTIAAYPLVVFVSYALFGVSRPAPGEVDAYGQRL
ncbi:MAG: hypothetical protein AAGL89_07795 [Pseudomonadota bacterium]